MSIAGNIGPMRIAFDFQSPPQVDEERIYMLALYQLKGFHYFLTYDNRTRQGYEWLGGYAPVGFARRSDWGNPVIVAFGELVSTWKLSLNAPTSKGYYRALIKKNPSAELWSWALEWNVGFRVFGFYGDEKEIVSAESELASLIDPIEMKKLTETIRYRQEVPIAEGRDRFFDVAV